MISGEVIKYDRLIAPQRTHSQDSVDENLYPWVSLKQVLKRLPNPTSKCSSRVVSDPNYPNIQIPLSEVSDHFYDTGLYECEWRQSEFLKTNHPYMGRMSFPENPNKPSRTITATKIGTSREAIIYKSEYDRKRDGAYRTPTVREAACIMGFPITFQFKGSEGTKWRLVGNAVCPTVSRALAMNVLILYRKSFPKKLIFYSKPNLEGVTNLNTFSEKSFFNQPRKTKGSRFRRHPFKDGNLTVTLSNYEIHSNKRVASQWITSVQYGNGEGYPIYYYPNGYYKEVEALVRTLKKGSKFLEIINNGFADKISSKELLQEMYESQRSIDGFLEPTALIEEVRNVIDSLGIDNEQYIQGKQRVFLNKKTVPVKQVFALYAINKIASLSR